MLVFGAAEKFTLVLPPVPEELIVSQGGSLLTAAQPHAAGEMTPTVPEPPAGGTAPSDDCSA